MNLPHVFHAEERAYQQTLAHLINLTQGLVAQSNGDLWIVFATAQRVSAQSKIRSSIE